MTINSGDPSATPLTREADFAGERGSEFAAKRDAYESALADRNRLIDHPDKTITASEYAARIRATQDAVNKAHEEMLASWSPCTIMDARLDAAAAAVYDSPAEGCGCCSDYTHDAAMDARADAVGASQRTMLVAKAALDAADAVMFSDEALHRAATSLAAHRGDGQPAAWHYLEARAVIDALKAARR